MGQYLSNCFVDVESLPHNFYGWAQLLFLAAAYTKVLVWGGNMIKDGSELLLLVPSVAGIVGSIVLPVLGAVPDGAIVLFSGLGDDAQQQLNVGIGALAGSTIMLLTVPWVLSMWAGRVDVSETSGELQYTRPKDVPRGEWAKLTAGKYIKGTGIGYGASTRTAAIAMLITMLPVFLMQIPVLFDHCVYTNEEAACTTPTWAAAASGTLCVAAFIWYLIDQYRARETNEIIDEKIKTTSLQALAHRLITARMLLAPPTDADGNALRASSASGVYEARNGARAASLLGNGGAGAEGDEDITVSVPLMRSASGDHVMPAEEASGRAIIRSVFARYDRDRSGHIDERELGLLLADLGESSRAEDVRALMEAADTDKDGVLSFNELYAVLKQHADTAVFGSQARPSGALRTNGSAALTAGEQESAKKEDEGEESDDDEADEVPEDLVDLPPEEQRRRVIRRSLWTMGVGTLAVLIFSDPMVDVISEVGNRTGIKPFYVAFIFAPLISNGSELIAAYAYAGKKSERSMTISLATLLGAACMNNTFCLSIFLFIVAAKRLKWVFTAEITAIVAVEIVMAAIMLINRRSLRTWWMFVVAALFPLSLALVAGMESAGLD